MEINLEYSVDETNKVVEGDSSLRDNPIQFQILPNSYKILVNMIAGTAKLEDGKI